MQGFTHRAAAVNAKSRVGTQPRWLVVDVEREPVDGELALEGRQVVEGPVELRRRAGGGRR